MPVEVVELDIDGRILTLLVEANETAYSSKEVAREVGIAHSTARKHLKFLFDEGLINRGKQKNYNKTFFYYIS